MDTKTNTRGSREGFWREVIASKPKDCSVAAWCERRGVSKQSFYQWQHRLRPDVAEVADRPQLLPVVIRATGTPLEIHFPGGVVLHVQTGATLNCCARPWLHFVRSLRRVSRAEFPHVGQSVLVPGSYRHAEELR